MIVLLTLLFDMNVIANGIIGGYNIRIKDAPYQVNYGDLCGGVLIHPKWALTSAHCGKLDYIRIGSTHRLKGRQIKVLAHFVHPRYGEKHSFDFDVQLLWLRKLYLHKSVRTIKISRKWISDGDVINMTGWGYQTEKGDYHDHLQRVEIRVVPFQECQGVDLKWFNNTLTGRMFCAGGREKDACQGDSGGPAVISNRLAGLSSFGYGCGRIYPGVYIRIMDSSVIGWIQEYTGVS